jgi:hypothetical protein
MTEQPAAADTAADTGANPDAVADAAAADDEAAAVAAARAGRKGRTGARTTAGAAAQAAAPVSAAPATPEAIEAAAAREAAAAMPTPVNGPLVDNGTIAASLPSVERSTFAVLDPASTAGAVADLSPYAATTGNRDGYVQAPVDAHELHYPMGCKTPVTRRAWMRGQWVRADVYRAWASQQPEGVDTTPMPPAAPAGHEELTRGVLDLNGGAFTAPSSF